jgi:hypothetical protein
MPPPLLYSTNVFLKFLIQQKFRNDEHYVWCSESFDATTGARYSAGSMIAPSSNPAEIYRQLKLDIQNHDRHSYKINAQRASLTSLAIDWETSGAISSDIKAEIVFMVTNATFDDWRPLLYIIPRNLVETRLKAVPIHKRASFGDEFIVEDLRRDEFDVIEL